MLCVFFEQINSLSFPQIKAQLSSSSLSSWLKCTNKASDTPLFIFVHCQIDSLWKSADAQICDAESSLPTHGKQITATKE